MSPSRGAFTPDGLRISYQVGNMNISPLCYTSIKKKVVLIMPRYYISMLGFADLMKTTMALTRTQTTRVKGKQIVLEFVVC